MRGRPKGALLLVVALFLLPLFLAILLASPSGSSAPPTALRWAPGSGTHIGSVISAPSVSAHAAPSGSAAPATLSRPSANPCQTPTTSPNWRTSDLFSDVLVTFYVPGSPQLDNGNFQTVPCINTIPTYTNGFWMNISTNVPITSAAVTIWGFTPPVPTNPQPPIPGFDPAHPNSVPFHLNPPLFHSGSFFFNDYRFFWPGDQVYFNLTLQSVNATPSTIYSTTTKVLPVYYSGGRDNASYAFLVASPWGTGNFTNNIAVSTSPSVLGQPAFDPNPFQPLQIILQGYNASGGPVPLIPKAQLQLTLSGAQSGVYNSSFGPDNHTTMQLLAALGPYPGTHAYFTITCWLPWYGNSAIDKITSPVYQFNWTSNGGWWYPQAGLEQNLQFTTTPNVLGFGSHASLPTAQPVNVSIHEPIENVTIKSAELHFTYSDSNGATSGVLPLSPATPNSSFAILPGLPSGGALRFSVIAKDIYGNPVSSGDVTYFENGVMAAPLPPGYGLFFFEAVDLAAGGLVPSFNYSVFNGTWEETRVASPLGFSGPLPVGGPGYLPVAFGTYVVTVRAFGQSQTATFVVSNSTPFTIVFYVASGPVASTVNVPQATVTAAAVGGLVAAALAMVPITNWFRERRAKAEAEQRRITL